MNLSALNNLDFNNAGHWPAAIKAIAIAFVVVIVGAAGYWLDTQDLLADLEKARQTEQQLRVDFAAKQRVMANIDAYRAQIEELQGLLNTMLRQLPTGTEMPDLLEDISNTGKTNGLIFELFKPENEQPREFYAAKPISIRARGNYHQFAAFVSSVAALSRIVTLENAAIASPQSASKGAAQKRDKSVVEGSAEDALKIEATLQTYRYLDEETEEPVQKLAPDKRKAKESAQRTAKK